MVSFYIRIDRKTKRRSPSGKRLSEPVCKRPGTSYFEMLTNQTGAFDTFGEILLEEHIHNQNGRIAIRQPASIQTICSLGLTSALLNSCWESRVLRFFSISAMVWFLVKKVELT